MPPSLSLSLSLSLSSKKGHTALLWSVGMSVSINFVHSKTLERFPTETLNSEG